MKLSHLDEQGRARMVDVTGKPETRRVAVAEATVRMAPATVELVRAGGIEKGDVLSVARVAGIMAAKQTAGLIPLCHPLLLTEVGVDLEILASGIRARAQVVTMGKTGAEMEALAAAAVAALTVYDMCKGVDRNMQIEAVRILEKHGGKSSWGAAVASPRGEEP